MAQLAPKPLRLSEGDRQELEKLVNRHSSPQQIVLRAKIILLASQGGNRFELLIGDRQGQYSIRINDQWRICFRCNDASYDVEIVDYHA